MHFMSTSASSSHLGTSKVGHRDGKMEAALPNMSVLNFATIVCPQLCAKCEYMPGKSTPLRTNFISLFVQTFMTLFLSLDKNQPFDNVLNVGTYSTGSKDKYVFNSLTAHLYFLHKAKTSNDRSLERIF